MPLLFFLLLCFPALSAAISVTDSQNNTITFDKPFGRIVSLAPHITELVYAAGAGKNLVGVSSYSDFPAEAGELPVISSYNSINYEKIIQLKPDLIITWSSGVSQKLTDKLKDLGFSLYYSEPDTFSAIFNEIQDIGILAGTSETASRNVVSYQKKLNEVIKSNKSKPKVSVFYQIWDRPLMTINHQHIISQVINNCGGENVFANLDSLTPKINMEALISTNPQVFLRSNQDLDRYQISDEWLTQWKKWEILSAVKNKNFYELPAQYISRQTPRILQGLEQLCNILDRVRSENK